MSWSPESWAYVWAFGLEHLADHPGCRSSFRRGIEMCRPHLSPAMPSELLGLIDELAKSDDAEELRQLVPHLAKFASRRDNA